MKAGSRGGREKENENLLFMEIICKRSNLRTLKHVLIRKNERYQNREYSQLYSLPPYAPSFAPLMFSSKEWRKRNLFLCKLA